MWFWIVRAGVELIGMGLAAWAILSDSDHEH
jgi:hypothetical protein